ncbi:DEAD/DEAH box helicase [Aquibacillus koreensis]|uniref:DEAD/DEAH box helicase n=1 Tax=Aquibacillus koreensis TaxID=279446 RepID=A0A9X3WPK4_9BACI|nr:DEAD/DEAH box helicase [Aquibacillus koreensis]MCT2536913.1 DEAD/DEAH box helicase [Aquibacillus koreensis]MDC3421956.1 DEAD/DEAH box helicase [Aquibacillus koreensis]
MNIKVSNKSIKERCGTVSFKSGESIYKSNNITFHTYSVDVCEATVKTTEDFRVIIKKARNGDFYSSCSCPTLAGYKKDCQHVAAVLLAIYHHERGNPVLLESGQNASVSNDLIHMFQEPPSRTGKSQRHFENREMVEAAFTLRPVPVSDRILFSIEVQINGEQINPIRTFLTDMKANRPYKISNLFTFDLDLHCYSVETDAVIQQLIEIISDEQIYLEKQALFLSDMPGSQLLIPPSSWKALAPLLKKVANISFFVDGGHYSGFNMMEEQLPLHFDFLKRDHSYYLSVKGLNKFVIMRDYSIVLQKANIWNLSEQDSDRLLEFKRVIGAINTNDIPIPKEQIPIYLEKVVPGLKRLGEVKVAKSLQKKWEKTPLVVKLYLDRVSNRLLAGLEFHYGSIVINPLESHPQTSNLIRNKEKEEEILQIMEDSKFTQTDSGYFLHNEDLEYDFLTYVVPKLQKLAQVYTTTAIRNRITKDSFFPRIRVKFKKERTNWLEYKFELDGIPDDQVREVLEALEEKRKYFRLRNGSFMSLETKEFHDIQRFLQGLPEQNGDPINGLRMPLEKSLKLLDNVERNQAIFVEESFRTFLEHIRQPGSLTFDVPDSLSTILRGYQVEGFQWMKTLAYYGFGGILADDMGLGKTLQSIAFILSELEESRTTNQPSLIVCPSSVVYNWRNELNKFAPDIKVSIIDGKKKDRLRLQENMDNNDLIITSYSLLRRDVQGFEKHHFHSVFFDEAQAFKNPITQTARAVKKIQSTNKFALTGTPVENAIEELWSIFHVIFPDLFLGLKEYSHLSKKKIRSRSKPFILRRMKKDVLSEFPEKSETQISVELHPEQKKLYAAYLAKLRHDTLKHLDQDTIRKNKIRILAGLTRLRQICCHPALFVDQYTAGSAKFDKLIEMIEEARLAKRRVLIFSQFTKMLDLIGRELAGKERSFFYLDGQTPSEERVEICSMFNEGERDVFLISLKAGGTGLNLTGADTVILYDTWWNPAIEEQAADRAYRIGQTQNVQVIKLVTRGTIEEKMNELQGKKRQLIGEILDEEKQDGAYLTEDDIRDILMLDK